MCACVCVCDQARVRARAQRLTRPHASRRLHMRAVSACANVTSSSNNNLNVEKGTRWRSKLDADEADGRRSEDFAEMHGRWQTCVLIMIQSSECVFFMIHLHTPESRDFQAPAPPPPRPPHPHVAHIHLLLRLAPVAAAAAVQQHICSANKKNAFVHACLTSTLLTPRNDLPHPHLLHPAASA